METQPQSQTEDSTADQIAVSFGPDNGIKQITCESKAGLTPDEIKTLAERIEEDPIWLQSPADRATDLRTRAAFPRDALHEADTEDTPDESTIECIPDGWTQLDQDARHSQNGYFRGGISPDNDSIEVQVWAAPTGEYGCYWPDSEEPGTDDETDAALYSVILTDTETRDGVNIRKQRGFKDDLEGAKEQARAFARQFDDAPEGWLLLTSDHRSSTVGWFQGGFAHTDHDLEIQIWGTATGEDGGHVFPDEDPDTDATDAQRFEIQEVHNPDAREDADVRRIDRGYEGDLEGAKDQARREAQQYHTE